MPPVQMPEVQEVQMPEVQMPEVQIPEVQVTEMLEVVESPEIADNTKKIKKKKRVSFQPEPTIVDTTPEPEE